MVSMSQHILPTWSVCLSIYCPYGQSVSHIMPTQSERLTIYRINQCCPCGRMAHNILPTWSECIPYNAHAIGASHHISHQSVHVVEWLTIYCINPCCLHGRHVSAYIAQVVREYPMWSSVSRYIVSIHAVYMVGMSPHILPKWSECIPCGRVPHHILYQSMLSTWSSDSQYILPTWSECIPYNLMWSSVSPYIVSIHAVYMVGMSQHILPKWSECIPSRRVYHHILYQSMRSTWSVCLSIYCPSGQSVSPYIA